MSELKNVINLDGLKEYDKQMKAAYIEPLDKINERQQKELDGKVTIATFVVDFDGSDNGNIELKNLTGVTEIDWGDGTINSELSHTYAKAGEYICKIYDCTEIGRAAFLYHLGLTNIIISDSVTLIGNSSFGQCYYLTNVLIGSGVTTIDSSAFRDCNRLTSIEIPESVTSIKYNVFEGCDRLKTITFKNPNPISFEYYSGWFVECPALSKIYVPHESLSIYKTSYPSVARKIDAIAYVSDIPTNYLTAKDISEFHPAMVSVTYEELKTLRNNFQLVSGQFYCITDYVTTTTQEDTMSVGHRFDIIVQALSKSMLSENASADYHKGERYFKGSSVGDIIGSNIISEQEETILVEGDVEWLYSIYEDFTDDGGYDDMEPRGDDAFVAFNFLENNNGVVVPVLFKNDMSLDEETGEPIYGIDDIDYYDTFFYVGEEVIDGEVYDKWRKIEGDGSDGAEDFQWNSTSKQYALTNKIVGEGLLIEAAFTYSQSGGGSNLSAWELKYCLDNDINRFAWADEENGKGVIYYMKDEWDNEAPYDFKNIMFTVDCAENEAFKTALYLEAKTYDFYTFNYVDKDSHEILDATMLPNTYVTPTGVVIRTSSNRIKPSVGYSNGEINGFVLPANIVAYNGSENGWYAIRDVYFDYSTCNNKLVDTQATIRRGCQNNTIISSMITTFDVTLEPRISNKTINNTSLSPVTYRSSGTQEIILD